MLYNLEDKPLLAVFAIVALFLYISSALMSWILERRHLPLVGAWSTFKPVFISNYRFYRKAEAILSEDTKVRLNWFRYKDVNLMHCNRSKIKRSDSQGLIAR